MKITAIKQQLKRSDRYSIFVDGKYAFGLSESGLIESRLASGQELDSSELKKLKKAAGLDKAYYNALRYVSIRKRSEWEIETYLKRKEIDPAMVQEVIGRLRRLSLLDDLDFAKSWIANRRLLKSTGKHRLRMELMQKHIAGDIIDEAIAEDTTDERQALRDLIQRKRARFPDQRKLMQYLARQGYSYGDIKTVLDEDESGH